MFSSMKIFLLIAVIFFNSFKLFASEYKLEWFGEFKYSKTLEYPDKSVYKIIHGYGYWEDNEGNFGDMSCIGWVKNIQDNESLEVNCEASDYMKDKFWIILNRSSDVGAGVGKATYVDAYEKYKKFLNKKCIYAINYY